MVRRFQSDAIVGDIYDAAMAPDGLYQIALIATKAASGCSASAGLHLGNGFGEVATCNLPTEAVENYAAYYHRLNPYVPIALARGALHVHRGSDMISDLSVRQTEFYTDFLRRYDTIRVVGTPRITMAADLSLEIGVHRGAGSRDFSDRDIGWLQSLAPHLGRTMQLRHRLGLGRRSEIGLAVLEPLAFGCVVCDGKSRILFANAAAQALEAAGRIMLASSQEGLGIPDPARSGQFAALIARTSTGGSGGAFALADSCETRLFALVTPYHAVSTTGQGTC